MAVFSLPAPFPLPGLRSSLAFNFPVKGIQFLISIPGGSETSVERTNQGIETRWIGPDVRVHDRSERGAVHAYATTSGGSKRVQMARDLSVNGKGGGGFHNGDVSLLPSVEVPTPRVADAYSTRDSRSRERPPGCMYPGGGAKRHRELQMKQTNLSHQNCRFVSLFLPTPQRCGAPPWRF